MKSKVYQPEFHQPVEWSANLQFVNAVRGIDSIDPSVLAQSEELNMYIQNKKEAQRVEEFRKSTVARAKVAIENERDIAEYQKLQKNLLLAKKKEYSANLAGKNNKQIVPQKPKEKIVVLGSNSLLPQSEPISLPVSRLGNLQMVDARDAQLSSAVTPNFHSAPEQSITDNSTSKLTGIRSQVVKSSHNSGLSSRKQAPLSNEVAKVSLDEKYEVVFTDNHSYTHAEERYKGIRSLLKKQPNHSDLL